MECFWNGEIFAAAQIFWSQDLHAADYDSAGHYAAGQSPLTAAAVGSGGIPIALMLSQLTGMGLLQMYLCIQLVDLAKAVLGLIPVKKGIWVNNLTAE